MLFLALALALCAHAKTVTYDFNITWVTANPDGQYARPVIGINNAWPIPPMTADVKDRVIVNIQNQLGNSSTGLHFHGLYQNGTTHMDGAVGVTQCQVPPGEKFTYNFTIEQPGTYWYHAHQSGQYPDGLRGPLIINDPDSPYKDKYDEEIVLTLSDWYHDQMADLIKSFMSVTNPTGAEPVPNSALFNDTQNITAMVQPGKTYMFRLVNMAAFAAQYFWVEGHKMRIVEVDGIYTDEAEADMVYITAAQRLSFLLTTKDDASANFPFVGSMDQDLFDALPAGLNPNVTGWLVYDDKAEKPEPALVDEFDPFDDMELVPVDKEPIIDKVDQSITLDFKMGNLGDGANYAFFNDQTYESPRVPTLYTALTTGANATNIDIYNKPTNGYILKKGEVVEIILNNMDPGKHPFHLHGHAFQMVVRSQEEAGAFVNNETFPTSPVRRDTALVRPNGNLVLRFRADNPDKSPRLLFLPNPLLAPLLLRNLGVVLTCSARVWLFHCHIQWHFISGLIATMIEAPDALQESGLTIPENHLNACRAQNYPTEGNAAGNVEDLLDMTGANEPVGPLPDGFTPKGIVALVFSIIAAFVGLAAITWYGIGDIGQKEPGRGVQKVINEARSD